MLKQLYTALLVPRLLVRLFVNWFCVLERRLLDPEFVEEEIILNLEGSRV